MDTMGSRKNKDSTFLHANSRKNLKGKRKKNVLNPTKGVQRTQVRLTELNPCKNPWQGLRHVTWVVGFL